MKRYTGMRAPIVIGVSYSYREQCPTFFTALVYQNMTLKIYPLVFTPNILFQAQGWVVSVSRLSSPYRDILTNLVLLLLVSFLRVHRLEHSFLVLCKCKIIHINICIKIHFILWHISCERISGTFQTKVFIERAYHRHVE